MENNELKPVTACQSEYNIEIERQNSAFAKIRINENVVISRELLGRELAYGIYVWDEPRSAIYLKPETASRLLEGLKVLLSDSIK